MMPTGPRGRLCITYSILLKTAKLLHRSYIQYFARQTFLSTEILAFPTQMFIYLSVHLRRINTAFFQADLVMESQNLSLSPDFKTVKELGVSPLLLQYLPQLNEQLGLCNQLQLGNAVHSNVPASPTESTVLLPKQQNLKVCKGTEFEKKWLVEILLLYYLSCYVVHPAISSEGTAMNVVTMLLQQKWCMITFLHWSLDPESWGRCALLFCKPWQQWEMSILESVKKVCIDKQHPKNFSDIS